MEGVDLSMVLAVAGFALGLWVQGRAFKKDIASEASISSTMSTKVDHVIEIVSEIKRTNERQDEQVRRLEDKLQTLEVRLSSALVQIKNLDKSTKKSEEGRD